MDNDNELDLGLGLSCGASSSKSTPKTNVSPNIQCSDSNKINKRVDGFNGVRDEGEHVNGMYNNELSRPSEKFFDMLSSDGNKSAEVEENLLDASNKRKSIFSDLNYQKKHEVHVSSLYDKEKPSHISITTTDDEDSTAENEDVADSAGQIGFNNLQEKGSKMRNTRYNVPHTIHSLNVNSVPLSSFSKESGAVNMAGPSGNSLQNVIQIGPNVSWDQPVTPSTAFAYAPFQSQQLAKDHPWGIFPRPQQLYPPYAIRPTVGVITNSENHSNSLKLPQGSGAAYHFNTLESSMQDGRVIPSAEGISTIKPGIYADVKFDGTGSYPDLPWVSTKGSGPNAKTISGVTYRFSPNQIKIVCACHGSHMTPEDFVKHANCWIVRG